MAQAQDTVQMIGSSTGNNTYCTNCGGNLTVQDGVDYAEGFVETYQCDSCGSEGTLREKDGNRPTRVRAKGNIGTNVAQQVP